jgi:hypothetical protein
VPSRWVCHGLNGEITQKSRDETDAEMKGETDTGMDYSDRLLVELISVKLISLKPI